MHPVAASIGGMVGAFLAIVILSRVLEWALFKRVVDDPVVGKVGSLAFAWFIACALYVVSGNPNRMALLSYTIAAVVLLPYKIWRGMRTREQNDEPDEALGEVFE